MAKKAGVSARTVSRALNGDAKVNPGTRSRIMVVAEKLAYRPDPAARALKSGRTMAIGVVANTVSSDASLRRIESLSKLFNAAGYAIVMQYADSFPVEEAAVREIAPRCDGLAVFTNLPSGRCAAFDELEARGYPFILVDPPTQTPYPELRIDRRSGYRDATRHLIRKGRSRLAILVEEFRSEPRVEGFRQGLEDAGLHYSEKMLLRTGKGFKGGRDAVPAIESLLRETGVQAVVCHNDKIALGLMAGLAERGIEVPRDLGLVGFDDEAFSPFLTPALSSIAQMGGDLGACAFEQLRNRIEYKTPIEGRSFETALVARASD